MGLSCFPVNCDFVLWDKIGTYHHVNILKGANALVSQLVYYLFISMKETFINLQSTVNQFWGRAYDYNMV